MLSELGIIKFILSGVMSLLLNLIVSFFMSKIITPKKEKYLMFRIFIILTFFWFVSKFHHMLYENRSFLIMAGYIVAIWSQSKDRWYKKIKIFLLSYVPTMFLNGIQNQVMRIKLGYGFQEFDDLIATSSGYKEVMDKFTQHYSSFVMSGIFNITYEFILISVLLFRNRKKYKVGETFIISFLIVLLSNISGYLSYFYLNDVPSTVLLFLITLTSLLVMQYVYQKMEFYQVYYKQKAELKYLKEKETLEYEYYQELLKKEEAMRELKHDFKNQLQLLVSVSSQKEKNKLMDQINERIDVSSIAIYSNNHILNILLQIKKEEAIKNNINISIKMKKELSFMEEIDLVNLFSNILDNAIHSAMDGEIDLIVEHKLGNYVIVCRNSINLDKQIHGSGLGLKIVDDIVSKYHGTISRNKKKSYYEVNIMIPDE